VDINTPPRSLTYLTASPTKKRRRSSTSVSADPVKQTLAQLLAEAMNGDHTTSDVHSSGGIPSSDSTISGTQPSMLDYVNYLKIDNKEEIVRILSDNGILSHKIFKSPSLSQKEILELGLSIGAVTLLFDRVHRFEKHVA